MRILIIGSKGFIGQHCVAYFSETGNEVYKADVVASNESNYTCLTTIHTDFDQLFLNQNFDFCINASGSAHVGFSFEKPSIDFELNVLNVHKLLVAIRTYNPTCKFINFSSAAVYGNPEKLPITETATRNPVSPYGFHKLQSEYILKEYHRFFNIATCNLRIFSAYGPGLRKQLFWDLFQKSLQQAPVNLFGTGNETRDFIYIDDLMEVLNCIIQKAPFDGESYNIGSGIQVKINEAVSTFYSHLNDQIQYGFTGEHKIGDPDNWVADISKIQQIGFSPKYNINKGLELTANWLKSIHE
ncbi:MAG: SDR family oxidoreductase [Bacteroidota bacterium]